MKKNELHLDHADLVVIDPSLVIRQTLHTILRDLGFRKITLGGSLAELNTKLNVGIPDLLIAEEHLPDGDLCDMLQNLRHHDIGHNPFVSVIATTWHPTEESVRHIIQSGIDDLIVKPISQSLLLKHIKEQIEHRKPFVVTSSYIGPNRRNDDKRPSKLKLIDVPNTLKENTTSIHPLSPGNAQFEIGSYLKIVNVQKLERHAEKVLVLVDQILAAAAMGEDDEDTHAMLLQLHAVAEDIARRMVGTPYAHVSDLCNSLIDVTNNILKDGLYASDKDVRLLMPLAQAIGKAFDDSSAEATDWVHQITASVRLPH